MLPPTSAHPSALSYRRDGTHSRPPSRSVGRSYPPPPPQGGAPQRHHRCPSHLYGETQAPGCKTSTGTFSGGGLGYRNFSPFGAQGEFSEPIIKIRQIALNSNSPKWPFGMILIRRSRVERNGTRIDRWQSIASWQRTEKDSNTKQQKKNRKECIAVLSLHIRRRRGPCITLSVTSRAAAVGAAAAAPSAQWRARAVTLRTGSLHLSLPIAVDPATSGAILTLSVVGSLRLDAGGVTATISAATTAAPCCTRRRIAIRIFMSVSIRRKIPATDACTVRF